jgi:hypothetical protein
MKKILTLLVVGGIACVVLLGIMGTFAQEANAVYCAPRASKQCISNIVYWYNSCGVLQSVAQNCNRTNQICQNGQCVNKITQTDSHSIKSCYNNNLYWYNAQGMVQDIAQNCNDNNQCTLDGCQTNACTNVLKCDGSTCAINSPDYIKYCQNNPQNQMQNMQNGGLNNGMNNGMSGGLSIALFGQKENTTLPWTKNITAANNDKIDFLMVLRNASSAPIDNVSVKTDIPNDISYFGNLKIDGTPSAGNVTSGIDLGTLPPKTSKTIFFTGSIQSSAADNVQVVGNINSGQTTNDSDYVALAIAAPATSSRATAAVGNSLVNNIKKNWYLWIIIIAVLAIVFVIIFRKLSSDV